MKIGIGIGLGCGQGVGGGGGAPGLFAFELVDLAGSTTITSVPNMRVSLDSGTTWQTLAAAGLTISREPNGKELRVTGFASNAVRDAALFHYEQRLPQEPNNDRNGLTPVAALVARATSGQVPLNTNMPGIQISATVRSSPVGVT